MLLFFFFFAEYNILCGKTLSHVLCFSKWLPNDLLNHQILSHSILFCPNLVVRCLILPPNSDILSSCGCQMLDSTTKFSVIAYYSVLLWLPDAWFFHQILIFYPPVVARCLILPPNSDIQSSCSCQMLDSTTKFSVTAHILSSFGCQMLDSSTKFWYSILLWLPDAWFFHQILIFNPPVVARC